LRRRAFQLIPKATRAVLMTQFTTAYGRLETINEWEREESLVSRTSVQEMVKKYFTPANRTVLIVNPGGRP
jgi:predicted Zn-dependent peptidase